MSGERRSALDQLDLLIAAAQRLDRAISALDRPRLRGLADRLGLDHRRSTAALERAVRLRLIGLAREGG